MRAHKEFQKQMEDAHDCEKCHGKIFALTHDAFGRTCCAYCNQPVNYPKATEEEITEWMRATFKGDSAK